MPKKPRRGGGKLARTEIITVRLDPKLRFAAELAARRQRRSVSSFIEWILERGLEDFHLFTPDDSTRYDHHVSLNGVVSDVWDIDEVDRFTALARCYPELLTPDEETLWKLIREFYGLERDLGDHPFAERLREDRWILPHLRKHWETFRQAADGEADLAGLPPWARPVKPGEHVSRRVRKPNE